MKNNQKPYEIIGKNTSNLKDIAKYIPIYKKYGVIVFRDFLNGDKVFEEFYCFEIVENISCSYTGVISF